MCIFHMCQVQACIYSGIVGMIILHFRFTIPVTGMVEKKVAGIVVTKSFCGQTKTEFVGHWQHTVAPIGLYSFY